ncbi:hypothetical protein CO610_04625 [Lysobacteraceae bacterium NML95-0200]|nr:hypothetical protein CO610_04625 [Xanthomonadaceae bacterium NML95-0200]
MSLSRHLRLYLLIGLIQWGLDCALMMALSHSLLPVAQANIAGRVAGAALGFWLNGRYTFASATPLTGRPLIRFLTMWLTLTITGSLLLGWLQQQHSLTAAWLAKPLLEAGFAVIGFVLSRYWVYR